MGKKARCGSAPLPRKALEESNKDNKIQVQNKAKKIDLII